MNPCGGGGSMYNALFFWSRWWSPGSELCYGMGAVEIVVPMMSLRQQTWLGYDAHSGKILSVTRTPRFVLTCCMASLYSFFLSFRMPPALI